MELARRAQKLAEAAPKLRAKGAADALQAVLDEDALSTAGKISGLFESGARRLFERLVALAAVCELTGARPSGLTAFDMAWTRKAEAAGPDGVDVDLEDLPAPTRWRERMSRVEAVIFAAIEPVAREQLARVVSNACNLQLVIDDIRRLAAGVLRIPD